ncbi:hypothetical protein BJX63DRAFT_378126 [Aspergillus granulosus]|uniref:Uncharacterized protein n=1 Tax=Aspergillus granulosus TaxID=176169 RepID=A0ABR4I2Z6_9EURO
MVQLPDRSASAAEVRSYITQILLSRYNADSEFAEETVQRWQLGRGAELHDASLNFFQQVFGDEVGFCLYRSVLDDRNEAYEASLRGKFLSGLFPVSTAWFLWDLATSSRERPDTYYFPQVLHGVVVAVYAGSKPKVAREMLALGVAIVCLNFLTFWSGK